MAAAAAMNAANVLAQGSPAYPARPIKIIVGTSPGGGMDSFARVLGQGLSEVAGVPVVIDNKPGAGTTIGAAALAKSPADGYTLGLASTSLSSGFGLMKLPYTLADFAPIVRFASAPLVMVVHPGVPARTVSEFITWAKSRGAPVKFGSAGVGTSPHLGGELLKQITGIDIIHAAYKGSSPATTALLAGEVEMLTAGVVEILPQIKAGKVRALAVTSQQRFHLLADVPTMRESGIAMEISSWYGIVAPADTPRAVTGKLYELLSKALALPAVNTRISAEAEVLNEEPAQFTAFMRSEAARWTRLLQAAGIQPER